MVSLNTGTGRIPLVIADCGIAILLCIYWRKLHLSACMQIEEFSLEQCVCVISVLAENSIADHGVQYILDTVIEELQKDESRLFIYVEIAFFSRWWGEQDDIIRHRVKGLVNSG